MQKAQGYSNTRTYDLVLTAILIALVFVATVFLNIKLPITANGGLIHLGTAMLFLASILFGPKKGAIAGAYGRMGSVGSLHISNPRLARLSGR